CTADETGATVTQSAVRLPPYDPCYDPCSDPCSGPPAILGVHCPHAPAGSFGSHFADAMIIEFRRLATSSCGCSDRDVTFLGPYNVELPRHLPHKSPESFAIPVWGGMTWGLKCQKQSRSLRVQAWTRRL